jgi:hypothetical protein
MDQSGSCPGRGRRAVIGKHTFLNDSGARGCRSGADSLHRVDVRDRHRSVSEAIVELRYRRIMVQPPLYKQGRYTALELTVLHASERDAPKDRDPIDWKLITNLPVTSRAQAIEKLQ